MLICLAVAFLTVAVPVRVQGTSMMPAYADGRLLFVNKWAPRFGGLKQGDVVAIRWAGDRAWLLKRVIALPGQRFGITNNVVHVDGQPLQEDYALWGGHAWNVRSQMLGEDECLVIGDNRAMPQGEHEFGAVRLSRIVGKPLF